MEKKVDLVVKLELTEEEAAALDRYMEQGCYDRNKRIKRCIMDMVASTGYLFDNTPYGKTTGATPGSLDAHSATGGESDFLGVLGTKRDLLSPLDAHPDASYFKHPIDRKDYTHPADPAIFA
jgi:hypothetical protein